MTADSSGTRPEKETGRFYIHEIQGLRTVAALLVAIYHIWFHRVSGGVDAFFVIAAYFAMTSFAKFDRVGFGAVATYWANTARRIFPMTSVVILATIIGILVFAPLSGWRDHIQHATASLLFFENWWLAINGVDYLQQGAAVSPFQQMWALSVQAQFYLLMPLVIWAAFRVAGLGSRNPLKACSLLLIALSLASFAYNLSVTASHQPWAYFDSVARAWEFFAGALLALHLPGLKIGRRLAWVVGGVSLLVLVSFAAVVPVASAFPGWAALVPVVATAGIVVSAARGVGPALLRWPVVTKLGDISFAFYLWHWPVLILTRLLLQEEQVGLAVGVGVILMSAALAFATTYWLEKPFRRWPLLNGRPALAIGLSALLMVPAVAGLFGLREAYRHEVAIAEAAADRPAGDGGGAKTFDFIPAPVVARQDVPRSYGDGCHQTIWDPKLIECRYGVVGGVRTIVLAGGSHSLQWLPALEKIAADRGYAIVNMTKSACLLSLDDMSISLVDQASCLAWARAAVARIGEMSPDLILTIGTRGRGVEEHVPQGYIDAWKALDLKGVPVLALRDNPWFNFDVIGCLEAEGAVPQDCDVARADVLGDVEAAVRNLPGNVLFVDFSDLFCDAQTCWAVRDGILVYRDEHHITGTFAAVHSDRLAAAIDALLERDGGQAGQKTQ